MTSIRVTLGGLALGLMGLNGGLLEAQQVRDFPLAPTNPRGNLVAPFFDGYFQNEDGTWTLSFGFMNRNTDELIEIPLGPNNYIEPAEYDGIQPTTFPVVSYGGFGGPRERGVFAIIVPEDFTGDVWWHLTSPNGYSTKVPGRLISPGPVIRGAYELSTGPQAAGSLRPIVKFSPDGPEGVGPEGVYHPDTFRTSVGEPITINVWAFDRGDRELRDVNMTLWKYQGPVGGEVTFVSLVPPPPPQEGRGGGAGAGGGRAGGPPPDAAEPQGPTEVEVGESIRLSREGEMANQGRFTASFSMPGEYMLRVRIDNFTSGDSSPGNNCCWSNGYVRVVVSE